MDWLSFGIALAGLLSTTIVSGIGIYFTYKARTQNYRELLYQKQLDLVVGLMELAQLMQLDADLVVTADSESERILYRGVFNKHYLKFRELERMGPTLLRVELYGAVREIYAVASHLVIQISNAEATVEDVQKLTASNARFGLIAREFMGIDALSMESSSLFAKKKDIKTVTDISTRDIMTAVAAAKVKLDEPRSNEAS